MHLFGYYIFAATVFSTTLYVSITTGNSNWMWWNILLLLLVPSKG